MSENNYSDALADLAVLAIPSGLNADTFHEAVTTALRGMPLIQLFEDHITPTGTLVRELTGMISDWGAANDSINQDEVQELWPILRLWLLEIFASEYVINYTMDGEILRRVRNIRRRPRAQDFAEQWLVWLYRSSRSGSSPVDHSV